MEIMDEDKMNETVQSILCKLTGKQLAKKIDKCMNDIYV